MRAAPGRPPLVVDPVMVASSGDALLEAEAVAVYGERLFPLATLVTPNLDEARVLLDGPPIAAPRPCARPGPELCARYGVAFLMKGGHLGGEEAHRPPLPAGRRDARVPRAVHARRFHARDGLHVLGGHHGGAGLRAGFAGRPSRRRKLRYDRHPGGVPLGPRPARHRGAQPLDRPISYPTMNLLSIIDSGRNLPPSAFRLPPFP